MTPAGGTSSGVEPGVNVRGTVLQRGAEGRWAITETSGAWIEADASVFVEVEP